ncbi:UNVERIFIED_CONTAM: Kinesin-like protein KIN-14J [Sesamum radiatum]|uniref:Kinesin-like protein KIN-14J n=1 Tax=Sesamum radiatum TaxID=300843 RepID=A0AAW2L031_SESRA
MDPQSEVHVSETRELDGLSEVRNGNVSGRIEAFNGLAEGHNYSGVVKSKRVHYADIPAFKISELTKLGNLESASSHSLFSTVNRILDECIEKSNQDIPQQSNMYKSREDRYHTKIRALETLATGTTEENEVVMNQLQQMKIEKTKIEEKKKLEEQDLIKLRKEKDICESLNLQGLIDAAQNYHSVLEENRKLYNEVQDLKGNIRVYCRIRPFLSGQNGRQTTIQYIGDNGELVVINPSKPGKDSHRLFKFNKVFGPAATQEDVFRDTQPLIRSVLDGYNVCIFAYGQTGSGKTYTMSGPNASSVADWGVNYRALNDLFNISQKRHAPLHMKLGSKWLKYNEQLVYSLNLPRFWPIYLLYLFSYWMHPIVSFNLHTLGIWNTSQPNGLAVPDASLHTVKSTADVLELMKVGLTNRAVGATALNERSSRSHRSILTIHVRGTELETNAILRGCLHLVDLAGSERVDRSEATGDRLREAQHINKSLSALGDVIFALAQKTLMPYRNSKLTQVLQSSLGGQAKTLMFVQLNPDVESYSETISTLKFAERVSGVELGAARSSFLKDAVAKKDEEIAQLRSHKPNGNDERQGVSPSSEYSDKHSEAGSQQSMDEFKHHKEFFLQSRLAVVGGAENFSEDIGLKFDLADEAKNINDDVELLVLEMKILKRDLVIYLTEFFLWERN